MALDFGTTTNFLLRWLKGDNIGSDIDGGFEALASDIDAKMVGYSQDTLAKRPAAGIANRLFRATNTGVLYHDTGSAWEQVLAGTRGQVVLSWQVGATASDVATVTHGLGVKPQNVQLTIAGEGVQPNIPVAIVVAGEPSSTQFKVRGFLANGTAASFALTVVINWLVVP